MQFCLTEHLKGTNRSRSCTMTTTYLWMDHIKCMGTIFTDNGYIEGKELDDFFRHMVKRLGPQVRQRTCNS